MTDSLRKAVVPKRAPMRFVDDDTPPLVRAAYELGATGGPTTDAERELFEAWMRGHCWACAPWTGKGYGDMTTRCLWAAWRDRAALEAMRRVEEPLGVTR